MVATIAQNPAPQVGPTAAPRLCLRAGEDAPCYELLVDEVAVVCAPVDRHVAIFLLVLFRHRPAPAWPAPAASPGAAPRPARKDRLPRVRSALSRAPSWWEG